MRHLGCDGDDYTPGVPCMCAGCRERERLRDEQRKQHERVRDDDAHRFREARP